MSKVNILHLIEGAKQAEGLTVIIDVFRAFSLECYLYDMGVKEIRPIGSVEDAFALKNTLSDSVLIGERHGKKCDGFDFGNSPSTVVPDAVKGKTILHTTSAGTQGIANAVGADEMLTGSLVNAKAIADYIRNSGAEVVSLVCMGLEGLEPTAEDTLCAEYIKSLVEGKPMDLADGIAECKRTSGAKFFDPANREVFPEEDFHLSVEADKFDFVLHVEKGPDGRMHTIRK